MDASRFRYPPDVLTRARMGVRTSSVPVRNPVTGATFWLQLPASRSEQQFRPRHQFATPNPLPSDASNPKHRSDPQGKASQRKDGRERTHRNLRLVHDGEPTNVKAAGEANASSAVVVPVPNLKSVPPPQSRGLKPNTSKPETQPKKPSLTVVFAIAIIAIVFVVSMLALI